MTWRTRSQSQTGEQNHRKSLSGQLLSGKTSKSVCTWKQFQQPLHQTRALLWHYRKSGYGRTLWNRVHAKIQAERVFEMLPWSFKLSILSFNFIFKRCIYTLWNPGWGYFHYLLIPLLFGVLLCNHCHSHSLFHHPLHSPSLQQFLGLWYMVLLIIAGFQLSTEQDTVPSASVSRTGPVIITRTLFRFVWWTERQIIKRHTLCIFPFFSPSVKSWSQITPLASKFQITLLVMSWWFFAFPFIYIAFMYPQCS